MNAPELPPPIIIAAQPDLLELAALLADQPRIACDTESNSLHAYRGRTCLIQFSTPAADYLVDPLSLGDISALAAVFANPAIEKVFHAAEYDLICLKRDYDFDIHPIFDTMAAARVCGYERIGLSNMLGDLLGIKHSKRHQTADWARRPLTESQLRYAQTDTHYLLRLRDLLYAQLERAGRLEEAREYFADVTNFELKEEDFDPEGFWGLFRPNSLQPRQMAIVRELYILRDELARENDTPSHMLISNKALLTLARSAPSQHQQLFGVAGLPAWLARHYGRDIIEAIAHGCVSCPPTDRPRQKPIPQAIVDRYTALHNWRKQVAGDRGVESDVIISRGALWAIAHRNPASIDDLRAIRGLGPWRLKTYGVDLLAIVNAQPLGGSEKDGRAYKT